MTKCVRIVCKCTHSKNLIDAIQKYAQKLSLEGILQIIDDQTFTIIVSGSKESTDRLLDGLYKIGSIAEPFSLEVEPFHKEKDYRGVFRVIGK